MKKYRDAFLTHTLYGDVSVVGRSLISYKDETYLMSHQIKKNKAGGYESILTLQESETAEPRRIDIRPRSLYLNPLSYNWFDTKEMYWSDTGETVSYQEDILVAFVENKLLIPVTWLISLDDEVGQKPTLQNHGSLVVRVVEKKKFLIFFPTRTEVSPYAVRILRWDFIKNDPLPVLHSPEIPVDWKWFIQQPEVKSHMIYRYHFPQKMEKVQCSPVIG